MRHFIEDQINTKNEDFSFKDYNLVLENIIVECKFSSISIKSF